MNNPWDETLENLRMKYSADLGTLHHLNFKNDRLNLLAYTKILPEQFVESIRDIELGKGLSGSTVVKRKPIVTANLIEDAPPNTRPAARTIGIRGMVSVPIFDKLGRIIGTLGLGCARERLFTEQEINDISIDCELLAEKMASLAEEG